MEKIIFIGSIYPQKLLAELLEMNTHIDFAANTFQSTLLAGLDYYKEVSVITSPVLRMKTLEKRSFKGFTFSHNEISKDYYIGSPKNRFFSRLYEFWQTRKHLRTLLDRFPDAKVIIYAIHSPFLLAYCLAGKSIIKSCLIVPDLPEFMSDSNSIFYRIAKKIDKVIINFCIKKIDTFALLSPYMTEGISVGNKPWIQIEGIFRASKEKQTFEKEKNKTLLYTGGISSRYGVFDLIEAFSRISNEDYRLWLCGGCDNIDRLNNILNRDSRIKYFGLVDKNVVQELQARATLLVNPRHSNETFTKYSFPSKTMEYLASGTPTVMCKLPAIPKEYLPHLYIFEDESIDGYANTIKSICSKSSEKLKYKGEEASKFIVNLKNEKIQAKKIVDLLSNW